jgi:dipeptidyl aminopeptidase/acylaminoacyl peptidase
LTLWSPEGLGTESALYVFDLEQASGSLLTNSPATVIKTPRWNPDGSQVVYKDGARFLAVDIETGDSRFLPDTPVWSPSGEDLAYVTGSPSAVWLADAEWGNPHQVAEKAELWWDNAWSPDGDKLGLTLHGDYPYGKSLAVYDLKTQSITPLFSIGDLTALSLTYDGRSVSDGTNPHHLVDRVQRWYQSFGWSSDSGKLLIWGQGTIGHIGSSEPTILASLPLNGSPPYVVAFGEGVFRGDIVWSPTDASRLVFTWQRTQDTGSVAESIVFDLDAGPLYTEQDVRRTVWSPDGTWLAMIRADQVIVVDPDKNERLVLPPAGVCSDVAWNPAVTGTALAPTSVTQQRTN